MQFHQILKVDVALAFLKYLRSLAMVLSAEGRQCLAYQLDLSSMVAVMGHWSKQRQAGQQSHPGLDDFPSYASQLDLYRCSL